MRTYTLFAALAVMSGCYRVALVDDVDLELNWIPLVGPSDALHSPYVQGARMMVFVENSDSREVMTDWTIVSTSPAIFALTDLVHDAKNRWVSATGHALAVGDATLEVHDGAGHLVHAEAVRVLLPDRVELLPHGPLLLGRSELPAAFADGHIRAGGTATYLARYWLGDQQLFGNGALTAELGDTNVDGVVQQSFVFEDRDWLQLTPRAPGPYSQPISVGGVPMRPVSGTALADSDVHDVRIYGQDESRAHKNDWLVALGVGLDAASQPVYGVEFQWAVDGATAVGSGDLYRYQYLPGATGMKELKASFGAMESRVIIHASVGFVDSTNRIGCAMAGHATPAEPLAAMVLWSAALLLARRRRGPTTR